MQAIVVAFVCLGACVGLRAAESEIPEFKQVTELPPDIPTCNESDLNLNECIRAAMQQMIPRMRDGVKELNIQPIDPFALGKSSYQYSNGIIQGRIGLKNVKLFGLSDAVIEKVDFQLNDGRIKMEMVASVPKVLIEGAYKADIKINDIKMTPKGFFNVSMKDVSMSARPEGELYERDGHTYLRLTKFDATPEVGDMQIYASGLFPDPALNAVFLDFVNQHWRPIFKAMLPETRSTWEPLILNGHNRFFAALPFDFLLKKT